jgi:hypothetical protein
MLGVDRVEKLLSVLHNQSGPRRVSPVSVDALLDAVIAVYDDCRTYAPSDKSKNISKFVNKCIHNKQ